MKNSYLFALGILASQAIANPKPEIKGRFVAAATESYISLTITKRGEDSCDAIPDRVIRLVETPHGIIEVKSVGAMNCVLAQPPSGRNFMSCRQKFALSPEIAALEISNAALDVSIDLDEDIELIPKSEKLWQVNQRIKFENSNSSVFEIDNRFVSYTYDPRGKLFTTFLENFFNVGNPTWLQYSLENDEFSGASDYKVKFVDKHCSNAPDAWGESAFMVRKARYQRE